LIDAITVPEFNSLNAFEKWQQVGPKRFIINFVYLIETNISGHFIKNIIYPFTFAR